MIVLHVMNYLLIKKMQKMKRTFVKIASKKFIPALIVTAAMLACAPTQAKANATHIIEILSNENTTTVQFQGSTDNAYFLNVIVNNPKTDKFTLIIQSEDGQVLFSKDYTDASFKKQIKILKTDDNNRYNISIRSSNKELENTFSISAVTKTVDDVVVTKL
jgi:hypothetical protein